MRVLVCDDHMLFGEGLRLLLQEMDAGVHVDICRAAEDGLAMVVLTYFDVILLDWHLPALHGEAALLRFKEDAPSSLVVVMSGERSQELVRQAVELGAAGFLSKDASREELTRAIRTILGGGIYLPALETGLRPDGPVGAPRSLREAFPDLTVRQCDVLRAALRGSPSKVIARELGISVDTVRTHLKAIYLVLEVQSRAEAVFKVARSGIRIV